MLGEGNEGITGWILAGIATVIATLSSVVAMLYRGNEKQNAERIQALESDVKSLQSKNETLVEHVEECRRDREDLRVKIATVETRLSLYIEKHDSDTKQ